MAAAPRAACGGKSSPMCWGGPYPGRKRPRQPGSALKPFLYATAFEMERLNGDSIVYDFNYMYTTNVREPVRADIVLDAGLSPFGKVGADDDRTRFP